jgi:hypothetical protein
MKKSKTIKQHSHSQKPLLVVLGFVVVGGLYLAIHSAQPTEESSKPADRREAEGTALSAAMQVAPSKIPPYHESAAAARPFPRLLPAAYFRNTPLVAKVYQLASEIPEVLAQEPCYCYCDRYGHKSLLDCYASDHAAG